MLGRSFLKLTGLSSVTEAVGLLFTKGVRAGSLASGASWPNMTTFTDRRAMGTQADRIVEAPYEVCSYVGRMREPAKRLHASSHINTTPCFRGGVISSDGIDKSPCWLIPWITDPLIRGMF